MKRLASISLLLVAAVLLAGCPKKPTVVEPTAAGSRIPGTSDAAGAAASTSTRPLGADAGINGKGIAEGGPLGRKIIYFDFDKSEIKPEFADVITAHAHYLTANAALKVKLEGNTDERGTREYNIGLGERRAQAVRRALMLQGVAESQITTVSFGAERPAVDGDNEAAWAQNRRVEMVYAP